MLKLTKHAREGVVTDAYECAHQQQAADVKNNASGFEPMHDEMIKNFRGASVRLFVSKFFWGEYHE